MDIRPGGEGVEKDPLRRVRDEREPKTKTIKDGIESLPALNLVSLSSNNGRPFICERIHQVEQIRTGYPA